MATRTYADILAALERGEALTYGALPRPERMHVQSMRRDGLAYVRDGSGALLESLDGDPSAKRAWSIGVTERGRATARALAPFVTGEPVSGRLEVEPVKVEPVTSSTAPEPGSICGHVTRKGTPCQARVNPKTGACSLVPSHGGPVTVTRKAPEPATVAAATSSGEAIAERIDDDTRQALLALVATLTR